MPDVNPLTHSFVPIAFMVFMSMMTGAGVLLLSWLAGGGPKHSTAGDTIYECGLDPMEPPGRRFPVKFYVVAMLFILFDVEIALLYPWAVYFGRVASTPELRFLAFADFLVFGAILAAGYVYLYRAGAFDWARALRQHAAGAPHDGRTKVA